MDGWTDGRMDGCAQDTGLLPSSTSPALGWSPDSWAIGETGQVPGCLAPSAGWCWLLVVAGSYCCAGDFMTCSANQDLDGAVLCPPSHLDSQGRVRTPGSHPPHCSSPSELHQVSSPQTSCGAGGGGGASRGLVFGLSLAATGLALLLAAALVGLLVLRRRGRLHLRREPGGTGAPGVTASRHL